MLMIVCTKVCVRATVIWVRTVKRQHNRLVFIQLFMVIGTDMGNSSHRVKSSTHSRDQRKKRGKVMDTIILLIFPQSKRELKESLPNLHFHA